MSQLEGQSRTPPSAHRGLLMQEPKGFSQDQEKEAVPQPPSAPGIGQHLAASFGRKNMLLQGNDTATASCVFGQVCTIQESPVQLGKTVAHAWPRQAFRKPATKAPSQGLVTIFQTV